MKRILIIFSIILLPVYLIAQVQNIKSKKEIRAEKKAKIEQSVKSLLKSKHFTFVVRTANPMVGPTIALTSDYDIKITKDSTYSFLPYYGEAYQVKYGNTDGGIKFETVMYNYEIEFNDRTSFYEIKFEVIDPIETFKVNLNISSSGYGNLKIISNTRQAISYDGILDMLLE